MRAIHVGLALLAVAVWGSNFVVIKHALRDFQPFCFATLRFFFCAFPFAFFIPRPRVAWKWLALYGTLLGAGQFGLLYYAMRADLSPGIASLVIQTQVFFTILISVLTFSERVAWPAIAGLVLAAAGLGVIGLHLDASVTAKGLGITVLAAFFWGCANVVVKKAAIEAKTKVNMLAFIVWSSIFAVVPLTAMTLAFEGGQSAWNSVVHADWLAWLAVSWQSTGNTLFAFAAWSWLLTRYEASVVSPFALLVPVFGMGSSVVLLGEELPSWKLAAGAMVLSGVALGTLVPAMISRRRR
jgi:O-acetylserine/cysteine efflux transporter